MAKEILAVSPVAKEILAVSPVARKIVGVWRQVGSLIDLLPTPATRTSTGRIMDRVLSRVG